MVSRCSKATASSAVTDDTVVKEQSFVLILLYPYDTLDEGFRRIERIRTLYKERVRPAIRAPCR